MWGIELSKIWLATNMPFPIDPSMIALEISKKKFDDKIAKIQGHNVSGIEGMLSKSRSANEWFILFDQTIESPGRIKFTIAHEFGHYLLHRGALDSFQCGQSTMLQYDSPDSVLREKEANEFASYLLMPIDDFRKQIGNQEVTIDLIAHCANRYDVSITACALKWVQFTNEVAIVVMAKDDFVLWSYPSNGARKLNVYFHKGMEVPNAALKDLTYGSNINRSVRRKAGIWHDKYDSVETLLVSDKYEMVIFLIRFPYASINEFEEEPLSDSLDFLLYRNKGFTKS